MAQDPIHIRTVITATGVLGDPHAVNWLITKMTDPLLARLAGEAFSIITGVDLEKHSLAAPPIPNANTADAFVGLDEDTNLPWPDVNKIAALWRSHVDVTASQRYFLGKSISVDELRRIIDEGAMRQRHAAALELALHDPKMPLFNTDAKLIR